jgi:hypothetical protein
LVEVEETLKERKLTRRDQVIKMISFV